MSGSILPHSLRHVSRGSSWLDQGLEVVHTLVVAFLQLVLISLLVLLDKLSVSFQCVTALLQ